MFETLKEAVDPPRRRERPKNSWIRGGTWELIDHRTSMRREGRLTQAEGRKLGRRIKALLKADRIERARQVGEQAVLLLKAGKVREAWGTIWGWHKQVDPRAAKSCFQRLENQTKEREALYGKVVPPGDRIPCNAERAPSDDEAPSDEELRRATKRGGNNKSGGISGMRVEDLKDWLAGAEREEEEAEKEREAGHEGRGDMWRLLVKLVQHIWNTGEIPRQMLRTIIVLIPKGTSGDFRGIGLLEVIWKLIERVLDERLSKIELHDHLHGFRAKRGVRDGNYGGKARPTACLPGASAIVLHLSGSQESIRCDGPRQMFGDPGGLRGRATGVEVDRTVLGDWGDDVQGERVLRTGVQGRQGGDPRGAPLANGL